MLPSEFNAGEKEDHWEKTENYEDYFHNSHKIVDSPLKSSRSNS